MTKKAKFDKMWQKYYKNLSKICYKYDKITQYMTKA